MVLLFVSIIFLCNLQLNGSEKGVVTLHMSVSNIIILKY